MLDLKKDLYVMITFPIHLDSDELGTIGLIMQSMFQNDLFIVINERIIKNVLKPEKLSRLISYLHETFSDDMDIEFSGASSDIHDIPLKVTFDENDIIKEVKNLLLKRGVEYFDKIRIKDCFEYSRQYKHQNTHIILKIKPLPYALSYNHFAVSECDYTYF